MVESAWIAAGAAVVGVVSTATVGIVGYVISRKTNRETIAGAKISTDETVAASQMTSRAAIEELEARSKREEALRNLRWAAELAITPDDKRRSDLGLHMLETLRASKLVDTDGVQLVDAALRAALSVPAMPIESIKESGEELRVVEDPDPMVARVADVPSEEEEPGSEGGGADEGGPGHSCGGESRQAAR